MELNSTRPVHADGTPFAPWQSLMWVRDIELLDKKTMTTKLVTFKRPYLLDPVSHSVVTLHSKAWMERTGLIMLVDLVLGPFVERRAADSGKPKQLLLVWDNFSAHKGPLVEKELAKHGICALTLPPNMTDIAQPMDTNVNGALKHFMRGERCEKLYNAFQSYASAAGMASMTGKTDCTIGYCYRLSTYFGYTQQEDLGRIGSNPRLLLHNVSMVSINSCA